MRDVARELMGLARELAAEVGDVEVIEPVGEGVSKTKQTQRMPKEAAATTLAEWKTALKGDEADLKKAQKGLRVVKRGGKFENATEKGLLGTIDGLKKAIANKKRLIQRMERKEKKAALLSYQSFDELPTELRRLALRYLEDGAVQVIRSGATMSVSDTEENTVLLYRGRFLGAFGYGGAGLNKVRKLDEGVLLDYLNDIFEASG